MAKGVTASVFKNRNMKATSSGDQDEAEAEAEGADEFEGVLPEKQRTHEKEMLAKCPIQGV